MQKSLLSLVLLGTALATGLAASPPLPVISSSFVSGIIGNSVPWAMALPDQIVGFIATDATTQNTLMVLNESYVDINLLDLFPMKTQFTYIASQSHCTSAPLNGSYFAFFEWLQWGAQYQGQGVVTETVCDVWTLEISNEEFLALYNVANTPVRLVSANKMGQSTVFYDFFDFQPGTPPPQYFSVPPYCTEADTDNDVDTAPALPSRAAHRSTQKKADALHRMMARMTSAARVSPTA